MPYGLKWYALWSLFVSEKLIVDRYRAALGDKLSEKNRSRFTEAAIRIWGA